MSVIENAESIRILDILYFHKKFKNGDEIYFTEYGQQLWQNLAPDKFWADREWFLSHSEMQRGSSSTYKITTKPVRGKQLEIVMKWNRMGIDIPGVPDEMDELSNAQFLSPFEEFQRLNELSESIHTPHMELELQLPLAIYVPSLLQKKAGIDRRKYIMDCIVKNHSNDIYIDIERSYAVIYRWLEGINIVEAYRKGLISLQDINELTADIAYKLLDHGFVIRDHKADHVIVKQIGSKLLRDGDGNLLLGYVDYELLERTPEREEKRRKKRRHDYLEKMPRRFEAKSSTPSSLSQTMVFQVPYIYGDVPSSKGRLWVVGNDPSLFDYFLPEKWRKVERTKLSLYHNIYYKVSRDDINLVLKVSKIGEKPDVDPFSERERKIQNHGFNSPFEEVSLSMELNSHGIPTIYPRAIYMTGSKSQTLDMYFDESRYISHEGIVDPIHKEPVLQKGRAYIIIWGYWNGTDEMLARYDGHYYTGINALSAYREGLITENMYMTIMETIKNRLMEIGIIDLNLNGRHLLFSQNENNELIRTELGEPIFRICNFELLKKNHLENR